MKVAVINIYASFNNTILLATDITEAETISKITGGMITKSQHKRFSLCCMKAAEQLAATLKDKGLQI
jgi:small subunit ribosomal protein S11